MLVATSPLREALRRWGRRLARLSIRSAAAWGCALGLGSSLVALLVEQRRHDAGLAAAAGAATLVVASGVLLAALARLDRGRGAQPPRG